MKKSDYHEPVMVQEVLEFFGLAAHLNSQERKKIIDATVGHGGHTVKLCKKGVNILGLDTDTNSLEVAKERLDEACPPNHSRMVGSFKLVHSNFRKIDELAKKEGFGSVNGILFDLGVNTEQLMSESRGFSFSNPETKLDMRLDKENQAVTAADLINGLAERQLRDLFETTCEFHEAKKLAEKVVAFREKKRIETVGDFLEVIGEKSGNKLHPATKPFFLFFMAVNSELENLEEALPKAFSLLEGGGRLVVISFHSGEDRIVKNFFKEKEEKGFAKVITRKPLEPTEAEVKTNPKARSAKARVLEKIK